MLDGSLMVVGIWAFSRSLFQTRLPIGHQRQRDRVVLILHRNQEAPVLGDIESAVRIGSHLAIEECLRRSDFESSTAVPDCHGHHLPVPREEEQLLSVAAPYRIAATI